MRKKVYICAPAGDKSSDAFANALRYTRYALQCGTAPVVPHFYALCLNDQRPNEWQMRQSAGASLLWFCDECWLFGDDITAEMREELEFCRLMNIRVRKIKPSEVKKATGGILL